jgi:hypothetical protein
LLAATPALAQDAVVRGTVRAPDGRPVREAEIVVDDSARARTDSLGAFTVGGLRAGEIELLVRRFGFAPLSIPIRLGAGQRRTLAIELAPAPYALDPQVVTARRPGLFGQVVDERGTPIAAAEIMVVGAGRRVTSAHDGAFSIPELAGRSYVVVARAPGHVAAQFSVDVPRDHGQELRIVLGAIGDDVRGGARRLAEGRFWADTVHLRDLDRRLRENVSTTLVSRAALATQRDRELAQLLATDVRALTMLAPSGRGPTSMVPEATTTPALPEPNLAAMRGTKSGGWCYFLDGEPVNDQQLDYYAHLPASWIESIEIVPNDVTNTLNRRISTPGVLCRRFIVVWTRR